MKIVITSGYSKSRHAIALVMLLTRAGYDVGCCLNVRTLSLRRVRAYYRFYGSKFFSLVRRRMFASGSGAQLHPEVRYISEFLEAENITAHTVQEACKQTGVRFKAVGSLNDESSLAVLRAYQPDVIVYAGGGILRQPLIEIPRHGVLNAHGGPLPMIRGMNAAEWALMHGLNPGTHLHLIDKGVDTGPLLFFNPLTVAEGDRVADIRGKAVVLAVQSHLRALQALADNGRWQSEPQERSAGKQHFDMHPLLIGILDSWLASGHLKNLRLPLSAKESNES